MSWQRYVSGLNSHTSMKSVWRKIRKIKGKTSTPKSLLKKDNQMITNSKENCNLFAQTFSKNSSSENYPRHFQKIKTTKEKAVLDFASDNTESYNKPFLMSGLKAPLKKSNETAAGPDGIYYQFLTHLPSKCLYILLTILNDIWSSGIIPPSWKEANIIPIPKPNRDPSEPNNYRPIALTSCLCKTLERMVNDRLVWVLQSQIVYGSAKNHIRKQLDPIHHQSLGIALGAFRTSLVKSLYAETRECSLALRRQKLSMNYYLKIKSLPNNPCYNTISNAPSSELFDRSNTVPPFGTRTLPDILNADIDPRKIDDRYEKMPAPWEEHNITFDLSLTSFKKQDTSETVFRQEFAQLREKYAAYKEALTDGSKSEKVAKRILMNQKRRVLTMIPQFLMQNLRVYH
ncbi:RNA-directed DNA polymerase from mobile element jockey [Elysia marginata]|uniref:RNA-directed DNA polymerase from mobile element jockey n=1 Tax=Elysia marginata TaxID=1093978 RepID=A0AAV4J4J3_9GAST|nr:RNA-directed DNA polymerase from mobile element jockey [Elysia marginata]